MSVKSSIFIPGIRSFALMAMTLVLLAVVSVGWNPQQSAEAASGEVVMLDSTTYQSLSGPRTSLEDAFAVAGKTVVHKTAAEWSAMTTAEFADYDAVVLGDPTCRVDENAHIGAAIANASTWGAAVDGNVILIGTDEQYHSFPSQGGTAVMAGAAAFSVAEVGKTGAYVSLSCYYHGTPAGTSVPMLDDAFGSAGDFTVTGVPGCFNSAHIVATHPALAGLTDADLSNWSCSVHEAFDNWPINFEVLAIATTGSVYTAPDGTVGTPYILARGVTVISDIDLGPDGAVNTVGETHTVTAVVTTDDPVPGTPVVGTDVTFTVIAGPHTGTTGVATTDGSGEASFSYSGLAIGVDTIEATFVDALGRTQRSNRVTKTWEEPSLEIDLTPDVAVNDIEVTPSHMVVATVLNGGSPAEGEVVQFTVVGVSGPVGGAVATNAAGQAMYSYPGVALGIDSITACVDGDICDTVSKEWVDATGPDAYCLPGNNPAGNEPQADTTNEDGFFHAGALDWDPVVSVYIRDGGSTGSGYVFGPYPPGVNFKWVQALGAPVKEKDGTGEVDWKLTGNGDPEVYGVDSSGNQGPVAFCYVPPAPK